MDFISVFFGITAERVAPERPHAAPVSVYYTAVDRISEESYKASAFSATDPRSAVHRVPAARRFASLSGLSLYLLLLGTVVLYLNLDVS